MKIGIIGGGLLGTGIAYYLSELKHEVTVLEQSAAPGGLNQSRVSGLGLSVSHFHHTILPHDESFMQLCAELGLSDELVFQPSKVGFIHNGHIHPVNSPWDFATLTLLSLPDRLRLLNTIVQALRVRDWRTLDGISAEDWLVQTGGEQVFRRIWMPLLEAKFDYTYGDVPATYIWAWIRRNQQARRGGMQIGSLRQGHATLVNAMLDTIRQRGGTLLTDTRVREIEVRDGRLQRVRIPGDILEFDAVVAALPTPTFARLIPGADDSYLARLGASRYLGLVCPMLVLDHPLSGFWTLSLTDPSSPFSSIVEVQHPADPRYYIIYLPKYTAPENDWMGVPDEDIRQAWLTRLRQLFPDFKPADILDFAVSRSRYVDPVYVTQGMERQIAVQTPYAGLYLANTSQVYPLLPNNESTILHAQCIARMLDQQQPAPHAIDFA